jgi:hypothetical protein
MAACIHDIEAAWCGVCNPPIGPGSPLEEWINRVSEHIPADDDTPDRISHDDLVLYSGLTESQVNTAVAAIRERHPELPLVSDRTGIRFTMDGEAVRRFRNTAARTAMTRIRRGYRGVLLPYMEVSGASEAQIRQIRRQFERVLEDIEDLLEVAS